MLPRATHGEVGAARLGAVAQAVLVHLEDGADARDAQRSAVQLVAVFLCAALVRCGQEQHTERRAAASGRLHVVATRRGL